MINLNSAFEDELFFNFLRDPESVSPEWQEYFKKNYGSSIFINPEYNYNLVNNIQNKYQTKPKTYKLKFNNDYSLEELSGSDFDQYQLITESLSVPSASATRTIPIKVLDENRRIINRYLKKFKKSKISFTHILAWAVVKSLEKYPHLNDSFDFLDGKPVRVKKKSINVGLAVDIEKKNASRVLLIPSLKNAEKLTFTEFVQEFDRLIDKARNGKLEYDDLQDATITLTNPGMIGTTFSSPRLFKGQGLIVSSGTIDYPIEYSAVKPELLSELAVSKVVNITSTYDHRIIHGAQNAEFLAYMNSLLLGEHQFYEQIFYSLNIPFEPVHWSTDYFDTSEFKKRNDAEKAAHVMLMINAYRVRGHLLASINPLGFEMYYYPELNPAYYGFTIWDLDRVFHCDDSWEKNELPLREIIEILRETYCGTIGIEFMHIQSPEKKDWIKNKLEKTRNTPNFSIKEKINIYQKLVDAEVFENYLHTKFIGSKRFSLEGGETVIVMLDKIFQEAADAFLDTIVIGMAHRGRLNVLANNIGKSYLSIFNEFEGVFDEKSYQGSGDVKYHLGDKGIFTSLNGNSIYLLLAPNPSHLELVDPVVEGMARALDNQINDSSYTKVLPILLHGDAAFAGQGIVAETLNLSQLDGYKTGGTIHIIINNQIGFTTTSDYARSTIYATDIAKMIQTPILHVNGSDPEAVASAAKFAFEYRNEFKSDVIIDLLCYRKYGHNESDEPTYTQPLLYKKIKSLPTYSEIYKNQLIEEGILTQDQIDDYYHKLKEKLDYAFNLRKEPNQDSGVFVQDKSTIFNDHNTKVSKEIIYEVTNAITSYPENFNINPKVAPLMQKRREMVYSENTAIDWAMAELIAFGTLIVDGYEVRFSGQDSQRGTFSQRHAVLTDYKYEYDYIPLNHIRPNQPKLRIFDSPLSEVAVLGFEYGYSVVSPKSLTLWEAQFGDFANNAQTMVDQYIACSEVKWGIYSNLVMLLPHGYDGQGPEHSSGRIERYLQLCAENNMIVANLTSPAQYFHILRRQIYQPFRIPLILFTPKGMLRHALSVSTLEEFTEGKFYHIIDDNKFASEGINPRKILICSGKIYYELATEINKKKINDIALIRIEQYYPFNNHLFEKIISKYKNDTLYWVQEEPKNMGAWLYLREYMNPSLEKLNKKLEYIGRPNAAATATGLYIIHLREQQQIIDAALS